MKKQLFILGDSISIDYTPVLREYLGSEWEVLRKGDIPAPEISGEIDHENGTDSNVVYEYLRLVLPFIQASLILLNSGLHDIKRMPNETDECQVSIERYRKNIEKIIHLIQSEKKQALWVTSTPVDDEQHRKYETSFFRRNDDLVRYNRTAIEIMKKNNIPVFDLYNFTSRINAPLYRDHIHFNNEIINLQAAFLSGCIQTFFSYGTRNDEE